MGKYVCLRDDDTSFYTKPSELIEGYGCYWGTIPITLAVVPFSHGSQIRMLDFEYDKDRCYSLRQWEKNASAEELTEYHQIHPIGENVEIVDELKKQQAKGMIEIAQHGVSHRYNEFGAETKISQVTLPSLRDGMEYLSKVFETQIHTFIPPSNTIDRTCAKYVSSLGMNLFVSGPICYESRIAKMMGILRSPTAILEKIKNEKNKPIRKREGVLLFGSFTYDTFKRQETMFDLMKDSLNRYGFAAIGTHYMLLNELGYHGEHADYRQKYQALIDRISSIEGVEFVTAQKYYSLLLEKYYA